MLTAVIGPNVKMMQSMLFIKSSGKPGQAWHQDEAHIPTRDRTLTAVWIALDDATVANGCLWVIPGSHRAGVLHGRYGAKGPAVRLRPGIVRVRYTEADSVPVELPAGALSLQRLSAAPLVPEHRSARDTAGSSITT